MGESVSAAARAYSLKNAGGPTSLQEIVLRRFFSPGNALSRWKEGTA
jgi:hypothetical protein